MRTIIAGSRGVTNQDVVAKAVHSCGWTPSVVLSGTARGIDQLGECYADEHGIPVERYPAEWYRHGRSAGYKRNVQMAEKADALIAVWDGHSRGTRHMIEIAKERGLRVSVYHAR